MFSFKHNKDAIKIVAEIKPKLEIGKKKYQYIYLYDLPADKVIPEGYYEHIPLPSGYKYEYFPDVRENQSDVIYSGSGRGSGKSTFAYNWGEKIRETLDLDESDIYIVVKSRKSDPAFQEWSDVNYVYADELLENPLDIDEITQDERPKIFIFDDVNNPQSDKIKRAIIKAEHDLIENGRKSSIYVIILAHKFCSGKDTMNILTEATYLLYFPKVQSKDLKYCLETYYDLSKDTVNELNKTTSRWILLHNQYPKFYLNEDEIQILDIDKEDEKNKTKKLLSKIRLKQKVLENNK